MMTPADLQAFMDCHAISGQIITLAVPTPTVEAAAAAVGTQPENIIKSVLFSLGIDVVLAISSGIEPIERRTIADHYDIGRKKVKLASADMVLQKTGYPVGTLPPFGHITPLETLVDKRVMELSTAYAGGGAHNALLKLDPQDLLWITQGQILDLHTWPQ